MSDNIKTPSRADQEHFKAVLKHSRQTRHISSEQEAYFATIEAHYPEYYKQAISEKELER